MAIRRSRQRNRQRTGGHAGRSPTEITEKLEISRMWCQRVPLEGATLRAQLLLSELGGVFCSDVVWFLCSRSWSTESLLHQLGAARFAVVRAAFLSVTHCVEQSACVIRLLIGLRRWRAWHGFGRRGSSSAVLV